MHLIFSDRILSSQLPCAGLKPKMKDHFRSRQVALWLNLIPDLVKSGQMENYEPVNTSSLDQYMLYNEKISLIPNVKLVTIKEKSRPASYQVGDGSKPTSPPVYGSVNDKFSLTG